MHASAPAPGHEEAANRRCARPRFSSVCPRRLWTTCGRLSPAWTSLWASQTLALWHLSPPPPFRRPR
eukprot:5339170-Lingulodinium_polyedra.AAC.1